jgi:hypothetical protein
MPRSCVIFFIFRYTPIPYSSITPWGYKFNAPIQ